MANKKLYIVDGLSTSSYYLSLYLEQNMQTDNAIDSVSIRQISIIESILNSSPYINFKIIDGSGNLVSTTPIIPDSTFYLKFGKDLENSVSSQFKLSVFNSESTSTTMDGWSFEGTFITDKWESMYKKQISRSWNNIKYSDVVRQIAIEAGFTKLDIEETADTIDSVIQPYWTNNQFLKWITRRSINKDGFGGYFYALRLDGTFMFKTYESLFKATPVKTINQNTLVKSDEPQNGFSSVAMKVGYMPTLLGGGFGMKSSHFDYKTKTFVNHDMTLDKFKERQLSDWYYMAKTHDEPSRLYYGGRDTKTDDLVRNRILSMANSVNKMDFIYDGDTSLKIGDVVNLRIPVSQKTTDAVLNETYSGRWVVWKMAHLFDGDGKNYYTHVFLMRSGINGLNIRNLVKTTTGKNIK